MLTVLTCAEVAERLRISQKQAAKIMKELPHSDCSGDVRGNYKTLRITETVLDGFMRGEIKRTPGSTTADVPLEDINARAIPLSGEPPKRGGKLRYTGPIPYR